MKWDELLNSKLLSFLWRGMTSAILQASGKVTVEKNKLNNSVVTILLGMFWEFW